MRQIDIDPYMIRMIHYLIGVVDYRKLDRQGMEDISQFIKYIMINS